MLIALKSTFLWFYEIRCPSYSSLLAAFLTNVLGIFYTTKLEVSQYLYSNPAFSNTAKDFLLTPLLMQTGFLPRFPLRMDMLLFVYMLAFVPTKVSLQGPQL
ncbi:hypothetical protein SLEP1_g30220 [Rubroshorea leprosula]|uniref:Uncharacterized protein n=1 Tax=Rubroshorea leprosula TaxID=152421 RepID=A0AAV5K653_9ROSI|nr:hypothetical protein SLEP1_g30220 [Rubroshorea leprosula]